MASKIKIDLDPQGPLTFEREVAIPTPSGKPLKVVFTFLHRTREDMAALQDEYADKARAQYQRVQEEVLAEKAQRDEAAAANRPHVPDRSSLADKVAQDIAEDVEAVQKVATDWNLDQEFSAENLAKMFRLYAKAGSTIASEYRVSMIEGRLGN